MHYNVVSPTITESYCYGAYEPPEDFACVASVEADSVREAKLKAIKHKDMREWVQAQRESNSNPFTGLKVYEGECHHGVCCCDMCKGECELCIVEAEYYEGA